MVILDKKEFHFSRTKFRAILRYFSADIDATTTAELVHLNRDTVNKIFLEIRKIIAKYCEENSIFRVGAKRVRGNAIEFFPHPVGNGRGTRGKISCSCSILEYLIIIWDVKTRR